MFYYNWIKCHKYTLLLTNEYSIQGWQNLLSLLPTAWTSGNFQKFTILIWTIKNASGKNRQVSQNQILPAVLLSGKKNQKDLLWWVHIFKLKTYFDLAGATHSGCSSGKVPLPMGVGRKGSLHPSTNVLSSFSHCAYAAPLIIYNNLKYKIIFTDLFTI